MAFSARLLVLALIGIAVSSFASGVFAEETAVSSSEYESRIARLERFLSESTSTKKNTTSSTDDKDKEGSSESSGDNEDDSKSSGDNEDDNESSGDNEDNSEDDDEESKNPKVKGDPHFTGADSSHFDFSGTPNNTYCLISDSHLHLNAYFGGYYGEYEGNPSKALTWIRKVGLLWGHHSVLFEAREGASWQYGSGYMSRIEVDGDEVVLSQAGDKASFADGAAVIAWEEAKSRSGDDEIDVFSVDIAGVLKLVLELRPEVPNLRTETDGTVHFDLQVTKSRLSSNAHGVLGQTFRPDHANRLTEQKLVFSKLLNAKVIPGENAEGFLDGTVEDYQSSALLSPDCKVSRFARAQQLDEETALAIELSGKAKAVGTSGLPRKMLSARAF